MKNAILNSGTTMQIPNGGFLAAHIRDVGNAEVFARTLRQRTGDLFEGSDGVLLACWKEFEGQGLWQGDEGAVAFDLDLTNDRTLWAQSGFRADETQNPGALLWKLYETRGKDFIKDLRGDFAFALWDKGKREFLVATDHFGIRPVVYCNENGDFLAGSRIRHILMLPGLDRCVDPNAVYQYFFYSTIPTPKTVYQSIRKLEPGCCLRWDGSRRSSHRYYDIRYKPDNKAAPGTWLKTIPSEVQKAVARHVPLSGYEETGCYLSGGTDSSSVAGYYTQLTGKPAHTFSIGFDESGYNEIHYAGIAARHFGTRQTEYFVTPEDVLALLGYLADIYDEPFGNSSVIPAHYCARLAREHGIRIMLGGDGGDEIFGGNDRYVKNLVFAGYRRFPAVLRKGVIEPVVGLLPGFGSLFMAKRYIRRANIPNPDRFFSYNLLYEEEAADVFQPEFLRSVNTDSFLELAREHYEAAAPAEDTDRLLYLDMKFTITDNDLRKVTQMSEAAGVRTRYPLLDQDLVEFTTTIPPGLKVKPGKNRYIFKQAMKGFLPDEIIAKQKHGFGLPIGPWFKNHKELRSLLQEMLFSPDTRITEWVLPGFLARLARDLDVNDSYFGSSLWVFLVMEMWLRKFKASAR